LVSPAEFVKYQAERQASGAINNVGDPKMEPLINAWCEAFQRRQPGIRRGQRWQNVSGDEAVGALIFELADIAAMTRLPIQDELAPYAHQFHGDMMMRSPVSVLVASLGEQGVPALYSQP
jgi:hypothetical protein